MLSLLGVQGSPVGVSPAGCWPQLASHSPSGLGSSGGCWNPLEAPTGVLFGHGFSSPRPNIQLKSWAGLREGGTANSGLPRTAMPPKMEEHGPARRQDRRRPQSKLGAGLPSEPSMSP